MRGADRLEYRFQNTVEILQHFRIPESQNTDSLALEAPRPLRVVPPFRVSGVTSSVQLDSQSSFVAIEVHDVATDGLLAAKSGGERDDESETWCQRIVSQSV